MPLEGRLTWAIRASFLDYIAALSDGRAVLSDGARVTPGEGIVFPVRDADVSGGVGRVSTRGAVRFFGHGGALDIRIADPELELGDSSGSITVESPAGPSVIARFALVARPTAAEMRWLAHDVGLTEAGADLFSRVYRPGEPLDPFTVTMSADTVAHRFLP
ncbi:HtaA domain-containing protein [Actinoplanes sp. NPDC049265]|uniref:HtaA domain-containing protein n=1 Tax=Actinoplanes sp. NPDC049265 TaxID=3363902 RepID=UPI003718C1E9